MECHQIITEHGIIVWMYGKLPNISCLENLSCFGTRKVHDLNISGLPGGQEQHRGGGHPKGTVEVRPRSTTVRVPKSLHKQKPSLIVDILVVSSFCHMNHGEISVRFGKNIHKRVPKKPTAGPCPLFSVDQGITSGTWFSESSTTKGPVVMSVSGGHHSDSHT